MTTLADFALAIAVLAGSAVVGIVGYVLARGAYRRVAMVRMDRRVARVERILAQHQQEQFESVDRLLFQLGELHDAEVVEMALLRLLDDGPTTLRPRLRMVYASLGLVGTYIKRLSESPRWQERTAAARVLGQLRAVEAIPALVAAMRDPHEDTRSVKMAAAVALGEMKAVEAISLLLAELEGPDDWASPRIAELVAAFGDRASGALREALTSEGRTNTRIWAAQILGRIDDRKSAAALMACLGDRSDRVRMSAAEALGKLRDRRAIPGLTQLALHDPVSVVRAEASRALGRLGDESVLDELVLLLADHDYWTRLRAIESIELIRPADTRALEQALADESPEVRSRAAIALERIGAVQDHVDSMVGADRGEADDAMESLIALGRAGLMDTLIGFLEHDDFKTRAKMCEVLTRIGDPSLLPHVPPLLGDPMWPVRVRAVEAIGTLCPPDGLTLLLPCLSDPEENVRLAAVAAVRAIGMADGSEHVDAVIQLFDGSNAEVRGHVIEAVAEVEDQRVVRLLRNALADPNTRVRLRAVRVVSQRATPEWTEPLVTCLADQDSRIRAIAAEGLGRIGTPDALRAMADSLATTDRPFREALAKVLARYGPAPVLELIETQRNEETLLALIWALGKTRDPDSFEALGRLSQHHTPVIRAAVAGAVRKVPDERSIQVLLSLLRDPNERVRAAAVNGVAEIGSSSCVDDLVEAKDDPDPFVRNRAAIALGALGGSRVVAALEHMWELPNDDRARAHIAIGFGLSGREDGVRRALEALADARVQAPAEEVLARESERLQKRFEANLHLDGSRGSASSSALTPQAMKEQYAWDLGNSLDEDRRRVALESLGTLGVGDQIDRIVGVVLSDPSKEVRRQALVALHEHASDPRVVETFVAALRDPVAQVRVAAIQGLRRTSDSRHVPALLACFCVGNSAVNLAAVRALVAMNAARVPEFIDEVMGYADPNVLRGGATVLGWLADPRALGLLVAWLEGRDLRLRLTCLWALGRVGTVEAKDALVKSLTDPNEEIRLTAAKALGRLPGARVLDAIAQLCHDPSLKVRVHLARSVGQSRNVAAAVLAQKLSLDVAVEVRFEALLSLLLLQDADALLSFTQRLPDQPTDVLRRFSELPDDHAAWSKVGEMARTCPHPSGRAAAIRALQGLQRHPVGLLVAAMGDPSVEVRCVAAEAAASLESPEIEAAVERLLDDPDPGVRQIARKHRIRAV